MSKAGCANHQCRQYARQPAPEDSCLSRGLKKIPTRQFTHISSLILVWSLIFYDADFLP
jgi:hypothetical protein